MLGGIFKPRQKATRPRVAETLERELERALRRVRQGIADAGEMERLRELLVSGGGSNSSSSAANVGTGGGATVVTGVGAGAEDDEEKIIDF